MVLDELVLVVKAADELEELSDEELAAEEVEREEEDNEEVVEPREVIELVVETGMDEVMVVCPLVRVVEGVRRKYPPAAAITITIIITTTATALPIANLFLTGFIKKSLLTIVEKSAPYLEKSVQSKLEFICSFESATVPFLPQAGSCQERSLSLCRCGLLQP